MTEFEKMKAGEWTDVSSPDIEVPNARVARLMRDFNATGTDEPERWRAAMKALLPNAHPTAVVKPPFFCDFGTEIFLGENVFVNYNCTFLDGADVRIGARTLVGPDVRIYTPNHPMDYIERRKPIDRYSPVTVGEDCWIGGGTVICPGVTIGDRVVVAAGSVVVHDVPSDVLVAGNPALVKRSLNP